MTVLFLVLGAKLIADGLSTTRLAGWRAHIRPWR